MARNQVTLKTFYYLDHFLEMIEFVERHYEWILGELDRNYIADFKNLGREAQCLKVRMVNRKGSVFRLNLLKYAEITDLSLQAGLLEEKGFLRRAGQNDFRRLLESLTSKELAGMLRVSDRRTTPLSGLKKSELLDLCEKVCEFHEIPDGESFVVLQREPILSFLIFLYFGKRRDGLQAFTLRDLGIVKTRSGQKKFEVRFKDRVSADCAFFYSNIADEISRAPNDRLSKFVSGIVNWPVGKGLKNRALRDNELNRLGAKLERAGLYTEALQVYRDSQSHPARERICRIEYTRGQKDLVKENLEKIFEDPLSDEELLFAVDFHERKFGTRKYGKLTEMLKEAPVIRVDEAFRDSAERAALANIRESGVEAYFTENDLWRTLFGVLFWEEISNSDTQNEFDIRPTQLLDGSFYERQRVGIEQKFELLRVGRADTHVMEVFKLHFGTANGVFHWDRKREEVLLAFLRNADAESVIIILRRVVKDFRRNLKGYPDLMVVEDRRIRFVEIKGEGDQIRRHQLVQMEALEEAGFDVGVMRVEWHVNPDQEYVVVDLETTGGRSEYHRITEIGAVKLKGNEVVGRFTTLVNPGRMIPKKIVKLTGISDEMVSNAPEFEKVASKFREFVGDAVFVAHSINFDYGFIRDEFRRIGEEFRCPTLCTVVGMRKFYPGLPSYGLAALAREFQIPLNSHHRAMCDAKATAGLLKLINGKRLAGR
ncbi:exonuclease domain-containing protein [Luteolibacter sp. AS25]|uniref:exonuclease domain-containing protein n=1 Tax=Luteolibacter sp. AS25 TaxID=3135776 RepID=UPI00398B397E